MENLVPEIEVDLDRPRKLIYDLNAQCNFQKETGKSIFEVVLPASPLEVRALLWAGLLRDDPSLTIEQVGAMVPAATVQLSQSMFEALNASMPDAKEGDDTPEETDPTAPTG